MMDSRRSLLVCRPRWATPATDRPNLAAQVEEVAARLGQPLMPWQRLVAEVGTEYDPRTGLPAFREVVVTVPRQSGKTTLVLAFEVQRSLGRGRAQRTAYTAQTGWDARKKLIDDQAPVLMASPFRPLVKQVLRGSGNEGVVWANGSRIDVMASTESAGHGRTVDLGVIDEAFSDVDARREQALLPAMATRADAQLLVVSTAGTDSSVYLRNKVDTGRAMAADGRTSGIAYFEWSADESADPDDPDVWWSCMPALGHTITEEVVRHARLTMSDGEFRRAFLNQWTSSDERVIPVDVWDAACGTREPAGNLVYAVDVNPDRSWATVGVAGTHGGTPIVSVVDRRPGTGWVAGRLVELTNLVSLEQTGPVASLVPELEAAGVTVNRLSRGDLAAACGGFFDDVADRNVEIRRDASLDSAIAGAVQATSGDAWVWARRTSSADVSPLVAVTVALWAAKQGAMVPTAGFHDLSKYLNDDDW